MTVPSSSITPPLVRLAALGALLAAATAWGATFVLVKETLRHVTTEFLMAARFLLAGAVLGGALFFRRELLRAALLPGLLLGLLILGGYWFQTRGLLEIGASRSAFLTALAVVLVPLLDRLIFRTHVGGHNAVAALLALAGTFFLIGGIEARIYRGDLMTLACAVFFALHIVATARFARRHSELALAAVQVAVVGLLLSPSLALAAPQRLSLFATVSIVVLALVTTAGAFFLLTWAQARVTATEAAVVLSFEPVAAGLTAWLAGMERWLLHEYAGAAMILTAMLVSQLPASRPRQ